MGVVVFALYDATGAPLPGVIPVWASAYDPIAETPLGVPPVFTELSGGFYKFTSPTITDLTGFIDGTAAAVPRYQFVPADLVLTFPAYAASAPLTGQLAATPDPLAWVTLIDSNDVPVSQPTITEIATTGIYKCTAPQAASGIIFMGTAAAPTHVAYSGSSFSSPQITNFSPGVGVPIEATDPIQFDITDAGGDLELFVLLCSFADGSVFVIHDGDTFREPFTGIVNARVNITNGFRYTVLKDGGWFNGAGVADDPIFEFIARDAVCNPGVIS